MKDLVFISNNQVVVNSRIVAERFNKEHKHVLESIRRISSAEISANEFYQQTTYCYQGRVLPEYLMNRDGFMLLVMGFTTKPAMQVKLAFINAFNEMEAKLKQQSQVDVKALARELRTELAPKPIELDSAAWEERKRIIKNIEWYLERVDARGLVLAETFLRSWYSR